MSKVHGHHLGKNVTSHLLNPGSLNWAGSDLLKVHALENLPRVAVKLEWWEEITVMIKHKSRAVGGTLLSSQHSEEGGSLS